MRYIAIAVLPLIACSSSDGPTPPGEPLSLKVTAIATGLVGPVYLTAPPADPRLFVVEQPGRIRIIRNDSLRSGSFLDITPLVGAGGERGLLSMAFAPDYATSGQFWVSYTDRTGNTRIERYRVSPDPDVADPSSAALVLQVEQPFANHNGGLIAFGPDGMLYVGLGDGGSGGDPLNHGQRLETLLGALLRIDVRSGDSYAIPAGNPFTQTASARPEIWAYGLRNPWRFSFDREAGLLFIADVGQNRWEEINVVPVSASGLNYGWNIREGRHCYPADPCSSQGLTEPVHEYGRADGCSVTGGYAYRGSRMPALRGHYLYSDYCQGWLRSFRMEGGQATDHRDWAIGDIGQVLSFGEDAAGELYMLTAAGRVYRIDPR
ncbi:PQQ-dependent sugar dehydrogenase [soil metagenome]